MMDVFKDFRTDGHYFIDGWDMGMSMEYRQDLVGKGPLGKLPGQTFRLIF